MDCRETQQHVHEYLHNALTEAQIEEITAHVANCDHCESHYDMEALVNNVLQEACAQDMPAADVVERILQKLRSIDAGEKAEH